MAMNTHGPSKRAGGFSPPLSHLGTPAFSHLSKEGQPQAGIGEKQVRKRGNRNSLPKASVLTMLIKTCLFTKLSSTEEQ